MDPISVIGIAGSVLGIVDKIAKNIILLRGLQSKYQHANLSLSLIISHLSTIKAAMTQISDWINSDLNRPKYHQLVVDLTSALEGCLLLVVLLDTRLDELSKDDAQKLSPTGKIGLLWDESQMKDYLNHLSIQITALNLLLTAIQCRSTFEQKNMLSSRESRRIMSLVREDTSSLLVIGDNDSFRTENSASTSNSKFLDSIFDFDREVFTSNVYRSALRSNMTQNLRRSRRPSSFQHRESVRPISEQDLDESLEDMDASMISSPSALHGATFYNGLEVTFEGEEEESSTGSDSSTIDRHDSAPIVRSKEKDQISLISLSKGDPNKSFERRILGTKDKNLRSVAKISGMGKQVMSSFRKFRSIQALSPKQMVDNMDGKQLVTKILLLGVSNSGKSTLVKSMDILVSDWQQIGLWSKYSLFHWRGVILSNLNSSVNAVMRAVDGSFEIKLTSLTAGEMAILRKDSWNCLDTKSENAIALNKLWNDVKMQSAFWQLCSSGVLSDNAIYFLESVQRISSIEYIPSALDIVWASMRSCGIHTTTFERQDKVYRICDVAGGRLERKKWRYEHEKWLNEHENVHINVFVVDIAGYHKRIAEDPVKHSMSESLLLVQSISSSPWFPKTDIILLFTKFDQFGDALLKFPLSNSFPEYVESNSFPGYMDGCAIEAAKTFITEKFVSLVPKERRPVCVGFTSLTEDPTAMAKVLLQGIDYYEKKRNFGGDYFVLDEYGISKYPVYLHSEELETEETVPDNYF